jgi:hypothetical protein
MTRGKQGENTHSFCGLPLMRSQHVTQTHEFVVVRVQHCVLCTRRKRVRLQHVTKTQMHFVQRCAFDRKSVRQYMLRVQDCVLCNCQKRVRFLMVTRKNAPGWSGRKIPFWEVSCNVTRPGGKTHAFTASGRSCSHFRIVSN